MKAANAIEVRNVDLAPVDRKTVAADLDKVLHGTYELLLATQLVHWNARGSIFYSLHKLTEDQYGTLFETLDIVAERMRALGASVPAAGSTREFTVSSNIKSDDILKMVAQLVAMHELAASVAREAAEAADDVEDIGTSDMLVDCLKFHEKAVWMLRAIIA